jgi:IS30 family transposase
LVVKFGQQKEQLRLDPEGYRRRLKEEQSGRYSWQRDLRGRIIETLRTAKNHEAFAEALGRQGVTAKLGEEGLYRFSFRDRHGLEHQDVSAERLYRGTTDRIATRLQENANSGAIGERAQVVSVTHTVGREAGGLVATLLRQMESAGRNQRGRGSEGLPTREDLRQERPRRHQGLEEWQERW